MRQLLATSLCLAAFLADPAIARSWVESAQDKRVSTSVVKDDMIVMRTDSPFKEIRVADAKIADVVVLTNQSFHVMGKTSGKTNVMLYDDQNRLMDIIDIKVGFDLVELKRSLFELFPNEDIEIRPMADGIYMSGDVSSVKVAERAEKIAQAYAPKRVTNALSVRDSHQVMLEVRFVEASRDVVKEMGIGLLTQQAGDFAFQSGSGLISGSIPSLSGLIFGQHNNTTIDAQIDALEENGVIRTLAEPNLVSMSGDTASFLAGGEFPIPVSADDGQIAIEFRQFGVGLAFTPTVLDDGIINLKVMPEVSQIDNTNAVRIAGVEVPSLRVRRADTTVELRNSQSFAIAGLLQNETSNSKSQVPWLGDVPVLGTLFRSSRYKNFETELVIIVTPRLVQPASDISELATPLDGIKPPTEMEQFLLGHLNGGQAAVNASSKTMSVNESTESEPATSAHGGLSAQYGYTLQ